MAIPKMPKELNSLLKRGKKVRDRLGRLSDEADRLSAEADKVLVRPETGLTDEVVALAMQPCQGQHGTDAATEEHHSLPGGRANPHEAQQR